jgi:hypothetical protein
MIPLPTALFVTDLEALEEVTELAAPVAQAAERLRLVTEAAEAQKARAMGDLRHALLHLGCSVAADDQHRARLARVLYWGYPGIPVRDIVTALAFADQRSLAAAAGTVESGILCERCASPLVARSRSRLTEVQKAVTGRRRPWSVALLCEACQDERARIEALEWAASESWEGEAWNRAWPWDDGADGYMDPAA